jgi:REP element-mobilizing transposase RayT
MARKLRIEYPGALYHLMNRGDRREPIFKDDKDRELFLETLGQACAKTGWRVHAYCLMPNHFHLVIETPQANLVAGMKWFLGTYTGRFNRRHKLFGHLFSGRYKSLVVDGSGTGYLKTVCDYVHLNPVRAKMITPEQKLAAYRWSSYRLYLMAPRQRYQWLRVDRLLGEHGVPKDSVTGRKHFAVTMEARRQGELAQEFKEVRRGWCLGDKAFRKELLGQMQERRGVEHYGEERFESDEAKALSILEQELKRRRWKEEELKVRRKGDKNKVAIAARLRKETTMTLKWIAEHLKMGSWNNVSNRLAALRKGKTPMK